MTSEKQLKVALMAYRDAIRALPRTFPGHANADGVRLDHIEGMKAALASLLDAKLPCDVRLPPATTIREGCDTGTLLMAIDIRRHPPLKEAKP